MEVLPHMTQLPPDVEPTLLPRLIPFDEKHAEVCELILSGKLSLSEASRFFWNEEIGFDQARFFSTIQWVSYRRNSSATLVCPPNIQRALEHTTPDLLAVSTRPPIPTLYVSLPNCERRIWGGDKTGWHQVGGAFVSYNRGPRNTYNIDTKLWETYTPDPETDLGGLSFYVYGMPNEKSKNELEDAAFWMTFDQTVMMRRGESYLEHLERALNENPDPRETLLEFCGPTATTDKPVLGRLRQEIRGVFSILVNLMGMFATRESFFEKDEVTTRSDEDRLRAEGELKRKKSAKKIRKKMAQIERQAPSERFIVVRSDDIPVLGRIESRIIPGYWTPDRRRLMLQVDGYQKQAASISKDVVVAQEELAEATEGIAEKALSILAQEARVVGLLSEANRLMEELKSGLQWVRPVYAGPAPAEEGNTPEENK